MTSSGRNKTIIFHEWLVENELRRGHLIMESPLLVWGHHMTLWVMLVWWWQTSLVHRASIIHACSVQRRGGMPHTFNLHERCQWIYLVDWVGRGPTEEFSFKARGWPSSSFEPTPQEIQNTGMPGADWCLVAKLLAVGTPPLRKKYATSIQNLYCGKACAMIPMLDTFEVTD